MTEGKLQFSFFKKDTFLFRLTVLPQRLKNVARTKFNLATVTKDNNVPTF